MYKVFGFSRDPFAPGCDEALYWEDGSRAAARRRAVEHLCSGTGVRLSGPPGSGRATMLAQVVEDVARKGCRVLCAGPCSPTTPEELLGHLLSAASDAPLPAGLHGRAESLYAQILEVFCDAGTVACFPDLQQPTVGSLAEAAILSRFQVAGRPLAAVALAGEGDPPFLGLTKIALAAPTPADLAACVAYRAAACGGPQLFSEDTCRALVSGARGFEEALRRARSLLARSAFRTELAGGAPLGTEAVAPPEAPPSLFDAAEIDELSELLDSLSPRR